MCYNTVVHNKRCSCVNTQKFNISLDFDRKPLSQSAAAFFILLPVSMYNSPEISDPDEGRRNVVHRRFRALTRYYTAAAVEFSALCCAESAIRLRRKEKE